MLQVNYKKVDISHSNEEEIHLDLLIIYYINYLIAMYYIPKAEQTQFAKRKTLIKKKQLINPPTVNFISA